MAGPRARSSRRSRGGESISHMPMAWILDFSPEKFRTVIVASGDDAAAKKSVTGLIEGTGFVTIDLGPLANRSMHQVGGPVRRRSALRPSNASRLVFSLVYPVLFLSPFLGARGPARTAASGRRARPAALFAQRFQASLPRNGGEDKR